MNGHLDIISNTKNIFKKKKKKTGYGDKLLQFLHLESQEFKVILDISQT